jgi:acetyl esterase/lipase
MAERLGILPGRIKLQAAAATCPSFRLSGEGPAGAEIRSFVRLMYPEGVNEEGLERFNVLRRIRESEYPPLIVITTPDDGLLYTEDLELEKALQERGRPYAFRVYESRENRLGHVFNVLYPEVAESEEANRDIAAFFLQHG